MSRKTAFEYHSCLATLIERFIAEKRACGYKFEVGAESLWRLDRFLCTQGCCAGTSESDRGAMDREGSE